MSKSTKKSKIELVCGKCEELLPLRFKHHDKANLLVGDPPYRYGVKYDSYDDNLPLTEYLEWTGQWLTAAYDALDKYGALWLFYPDELVSEVDVFCKRTLGLYKRCHIVWFYTFGVCNSSGKNFSRSHTHILYYVKTKSKFTFNGGTISVPSARALRYNDKRANPAGKAPDNTWILLKEHLEEVMKPDQDTWLENRICGTYRERQKAVPNQIPLPIMERIVLACSNPGDLVGDPFGGSFTTGVAAYKHKRNFWGCDISKKYVRAGEKRILTGR